MFLSGQVSSFCHSLNIWNKNLIFVRFPLRFVCTPIISVSFLTWQKKRSFWNTDKKCKAFFVSVLNFIFVSFLTWQKQKYYFCFCFKLRFCKFLYLFFIFSLSFLYLFFVSFLYLFLQKRYKEKIKKRYKKCFFCLNS